MEEDSQQMQTMEMLVSLRDAFHLQLPSKLREIQSAWQAVKDAGDSDQIEVLKSLHLKAHTLAGSALTFGAELVGKTAQSIENTIDSWGYLEQERSAEVAVRLNEEEIHTIQSLMDQLESEVANSHPESGPVSEAPAVREFTSGPNNRIYLVEDDDMLARDIKEALTLHDYEVTCFEHLQDFISHNGKAGLPAAIIMDMVFEEDIDAGAKVIDSLREQYNYLPPVIFISVRKDVQARLAAVRAAGSSRFFTKPLDKERLVRTLDELTGSKVKAPYRLLVVDDDESLTDYYSGLFTQYRIDVKVLSDPMQVLEVMKDFQPELFLLDLYMPECSGLELAAMIRQDDDWAQTPIMFLSSEHDMGKKLAAMDLGGDDFLTKPVDPNHLLAVVLARLKRSRVMNRLNTELKETLKHSEYQRIALNQHGVVSVTDPQGAITLVNDRFCKVSGYERKDIIGQDYRLLNSDYHPPEFFEKMWSTISSGKVWRGMVCNRNRVGGRFWLDSTIVPFLDDQGIPYQYVAISTDITALVQAQQALRKSENDFRSIYENMQDIFYQTDVEGRIVMISPSVNRYVDSSANQLIGRNIRDFYANPDDREKMLQLMRDNGGSIRDHEVVFRVKDDREVWFSINAHFIYDQTGKIAAGAEGVARDITQARQAQQELMLAKEAAENASRAKSEFLSSMSHELRTPLNAIMGFSQVLCMDSTLTPLQIEDIKIIESSGEHLLELINEILDLARIEAGRVDMSIEAVSLMSILQECKTMIGPLLTKYEIQTEGYGQNCGDVVVRADYIRLKQVLLNFLTNACKYNRRGGNIEVSCKIQDDKAHIMVTDTGQGLSEEQQTRLFKSFERLGAEDSEIEGTGIGLVIARQLIELMGGEIGVESEQGIGCTFWIELALDEKIVDIIEGGTEVLSEGEEPVPEYEYTVLYIEDNPANLKLVSRLLSKRPGVNLITAHEPGLGMELAEARCPDLILLDINLPGMNGYEVLERLRAMEATQEIPVIAVSANAMQKDIEKGEAAGFNDYITKPINVDKFMTAIDSVLN